MRRGCSTPGASTSGSNGLGHWHNECLDETLQSSYLSDQEGLLPSKLGDDMAHLVRVHTRGARLRPRKLGVDLSEISSCLTVRVVVVISSKGYAFFV
jgi:hypothetical protein